MKKASFLLFLFLFSYPCLVAAQQSPYTRDAQVWTEIQITVPLKKVKDKKGKSFDRVNFILDGISRFGRDVKFPVDDRASIGLDFGINKYFRIAPGYLYQRFEEVPGVKTYESRFTLAGSVEKKLWDFNFRHRSLYEYKFRNGRANTQVYRPRLIISHPLQYHKKELFSPYVSEEPYYDSFTHVWNRNEFLAGVSRKFNSALTADFFYLNQANKQLPRRANGFGVTFRVRIDHH